MPNLKVFQLIEKKGGMSANIVKAVSKERNFDEGLDDLCLIDDVDGNIQKSEGLYIWTIDDDELLRTLYVERQCPKSIIASVFGKDEAFINQRISELNLKQS